MYKSASGSAAQGCVYEQALDAYLEAYLHNRDFSAIQALLGDTFVGFGTGPGEYAFTRGDALAGYAQDIQNAPDPIAAEIHERHIHQVNADCAVAALLLDMETCIKGQCIKFNQLRLSITFVREQGEVRMVSMHVSFPTDIHGADEAFPLRELEERAVVLQRMVRDETKTLLEAYHELEQAVITDAVSGLHSRVHFERVLENEHARFEQFGRGYALVLIDLDHFKAVNDKLGHLEGDRVLYAVGTMIKSHLRDVDRACRWGGDEFLILLPQSDVIEAAEWARRLQQAMEQADPSAFHDTGLSMGVGAIHADESAQDLFKRVDQGLYRAKHSGRGQVVVCD